RSVNGDAEGRVQSRSQRRRFATADGNADDGASFRPVYGRLIDRDAPWAARDVRIRCEHYGLTRAPQAPSALTVVMAGAAILRVRASGDALASTWREAWLAYGDRRIRVGIQLVNAEHGVAARDDGTHRQEPGGARRLARHRSKPPKGKDIAPV